MPGNAARRQERRNLILEHPSRAIPAPYPGFFEPCHATQRDSVPKHGSWLHKIQHDGSPYTITVIWPRAAVCRQEPKARLSREHWRYKRPGRPPHPRAASTQKAFRTGGRRSYQRTQLPSAPFYRWPGDLLWRMPSLFEVKLSAGAGATSAAFLQ